MEDLVRDVAEDGVPPAFTELIARRFSLLGEPMRIRLLDALAQQGEASVTELAEALDAGHANVSKHLNLLFAERIVGREKVGTSVRYRIVDQQVLELCDLVCGSIRDQLRELSSLVEPGRVQATSGEREQIHEPSNEGATQ